MGSSQLSLRKAGDAVLDSGGRYVDMRVQWVLENERGEFFDDSEVLLDVGGRWDSLLSSWDGPGEAAIRIGITRGQAEAARFLARWVFARIHGLPFTEDGKKIYSLLFEGGRRGGKTDLGVKFLSTVFPVAFPGTWSWLVSETEDKTEELELVVDGLLPPEWFDKLGAPSNTYTLKNGSIIWLRSAHKPMALKKGRCDCVALNEAQLMSKKVFEVVRGSISDTEGLVISMANPPDEPIGYWVEDYRDEALAGHRHARVFRFESRDNPHVSHESLEAMREDMDERTYRREVLGEFLPREDVVFYGWSDLKDGNIRPTPDPKLVKPITTAFVRRFAHRDFERVLGIDFQRVPYPCAVELEMYPDPDAPDGEPLIWVVDETVVEGGDEEALSGELVDKGYDKKTTLLICDSSGAFQGIDRKKETPSFDILKSLGWLHVVKCDRNMDKNPKVEERVKVGNALIKNAENKRRLFSVPENLLTNAAMKKWEKRRGIPYRRSEYAHLADAVTYPLWYFYPRKKPKRGAPKPGTIIPIKPLQVGIKTL